MADLSIAPRALDDGGGGAAGADDDGPMPLLMKSMMKVVTTIMMNDVGEGDGGEMSVAFPLKCFAPLEAPFVLPSGPLHREGGHDEGQEWLMPTLMEPLVCTVTACRSKQRLFLRAY